MKKTILWLGVILFILGALAFFLAGSTTNSQPTVPFLYGTNQLYWMFTIFIGVLVIIVGAFLKQKKLKIQKK